MPNKIFISGISGTGMGPLAIMAKDAGLEVTGSDLHQGPIDPELEKAGITYKIGPQTNEYIKEVDPDWFVYTSALPEDHPELKYARENGIKCSKRDELIACLVEKLNLKMVAVAGTHGKTTTTSMLIWTSLKLGLKASYLVGTTLGFAKSGSYEKGDRFFIYEADEYDRNFLHFHPWLSIITFVSYDHPDIYKTEADYKAAFEQFENQSEHVLYGGGVDSRIFLAGRARREDATSALKALAKMCEAEGIKIVKNGESEDAQFPSDESAHEISEDKIIEILNDFPGVGRRFEKLKDGIYSDYAHHPEEIAATIEIAKEEAKRTGKKGIIAIYEPHQNTRQHEVFDGYKDAFNGVNKLFWLPTYLTREDESLKILTPEDFIKSLNNSEIGEPARTDDSLALKLKKYHDEGYLILLMTAGPADAWLRQLLK